MLDCMASGRDKVRAALTPLNVTLYVNSVDETASIPRAYMFTESETPSLFRGWGEDIVHLHIWSRNQAEAQQLEDAVVGLDDWSGITSGNAIDPRWGLQSKTRFQEENGTWNTAILYSVRYGDKRKLLSA